MGGEDLESRVERLERETGITEQKLEQEFKRFARDRGLELREYNIEPHGGGPAGDHAVYDVTGGLNLTDMKDIRESFTKAMLEPEDDGAKLTVYK